jgi:hypothetical protein
VNTLQLLFDDWDHSDRTPCSLFPLFPNGSRMMLHGADDGTMLKVLVVDMFPTSSLVVNDLGDIMMTATMTSMNVTI